MALAGHVMQSGIKADMVPLLYGAQGARKSTGVRLISPISEPYGSFNLNCKDVRPMAVDSCLWHHDHLLTVQLPPYRHSH
ncbi:TPA: hypothetical protein QHO33_003157 [Citrobacter freundii]|uniref:Virulence-associated protein E-like domain-containing protein n=2 Tax=Enterobacterales TaxID=91347 RepID=A0A8I0SVV8_CITAM|nr:hypothetical protein [Salmonella enterica subsp. enterica serovar Derby]ECQ2770884.1 hypothetical protein [Salmonella enterica]EDW7940953.1 hypothetical protein [Salmonella enterica subsp. enterica serovar Ruiru]EHK0947979.1 hypothetical protein [Citrobacter farmeri]MBE0127976.1 hypothetical protein [Citrobacter amalonaticus]HAU5664613.1 hypothetical protein [Citrobacter freundii]